MKTLPRLIWASLMLSLFVVGCRDDKAIGPEPPYSDNSTKLFFAECEPLRFQVGLEESVTLLPEADEACADMINMPAGERAEWRSNALFPDPGTYAEGIHLVIERTLEAAQDPGQLLVYFSGIATEYNAAFVLPINETRTVIDTVVTGTIETPPDSARDLTIHVTSVSTSVLLNPNPASGSFVVTEVRREHLCELELVFGSGGGIGEPGQTTPYTIVEATDEVERNLFLDFTGGASALDNALRFGPNYGVSYMVISSGVCRDSAAFWAPAQDEGYRAELLATELVGNPITNGEQVWYWNLESVPGDPADLLVKVTFANENLLFSKTVYGNAWGTEVKYDAQNDLIWVITHYLDEPDSMWGYTTVGVPDSIVATESIPYDANISRGQWVYLSGSDRFWNEYSVSPLNMNSSTLLGRFPSELTEGFAGGAGVGRPGAAGKDEWSINVFDAATRWVASYPADANRQNTVVFAVDLLSADDVIYYHAREYDTMYYTWRDEIRALRPQ